MKNSVLVFCAVLTFSCLASAGPSIFSCKAETGDGTEEVNISIDFGGTASLAVNGKPVLGCQNGVVNEYARVESSYYIKCENKAKIYFRDTGDETVLEIGNLKLNLSHTTYMCDLVRSK